MSEAYSAPSRVIHAWAVGKLAHYWMAAVIYSFLAMVFTLTYKMDPATVSVAMMLPRLIDLVIDPMLGRLSDNTHTAWGRRRPFIFVTTILGAALVAGIWWMPAAWAADWRGFVFLTSMATVLYANLGAFEMAHGALSYELTDDYSQRSRVQALGAFWMSLGSLGGGYTYWLAQRPFFGTGAEGEINGFRTLSVAMAAIILIFGLMSVFLCRERFARSNRKHVNVWRALKETMTNKPFVVILAVRLIAAFGTALFATMAVYIGIYSVCSGNKELYNLVKGGWMGTAGFVLGFALVWMAAPITRWLGKRRGLIVCYALTLVNACCAPFYMQPGGVYFWFFCGLAFLPVTVVLGNLQASVMPDICDLDELEHGERREGLFTAVMSFLTKLESSICIGLGGVLLTMSGFDATLPQQTPEVLEKMRLYGFTPMIGGALVSLVVICFFPLSKQRMDEVRAALDARRKAAEVG